LRRGGGGGAFTRPLLFLQAAQPLALGAPARALLPAAAVAWLAAGGGCRLHATLALGVGWPMLTLGAASLLAAPLAGGPRRPRASAVSPTKTGAAAPPAAPASAAAPVIAVGALAAAPAVAAQAALAWAAPAAAPGSFLARALAVCAG
jgi:hypothetical protein